MPFFHFSFFNYALEHDRGEKTCFFIYLIDIKTEMVVTFENNWTTDFDMYVLCNILCLCRYQFNDFNPKRMISYYDWMFSNIEERLGWCMK